MMAAKKKKATTKPDVAQNAHSVFQQLIERSEQPANRGKLKAAPPPAKKNGATK